MKRPTNRRAVDLRASRDGLDGIVLTGVAPLTIQRKLIPDVVREIQQYHRGCSIVLIGSVARREERQESDLDLNIFFSDDSVTSSWATSTNRWQLQVMCEMSGIRVDVAWETFGFLEEELQTDGPFWILSYAEVLHDPNRIVEPLLLRARQWASENVELCASMEANFRESKAKQLERLRSNEA